MTRDAASYRDRRGHVHLVGGRVLRSVLEPGRDDYEFVRDSGLPRRLIERGWLIDATDLDTAAHRLPQIIAERGWGLHATEILEPSLEDVFVRIVAGQVAAP